MSIRGRKYSKTVLTRPRKGGGKKARRQRDQKKRLVALGMKEEEVATMNSREVLTALKHPLKVAKAATAAKSAKSAEPAGTDKPAKASKAPKAAE